MPPQRSDRDPAKERRTNPVISVKRALFVLAGVALALVLVARGTASGEHEAPHARETDASEVAPAGSSRAPAASIAAAPPATFATTAPLPVDDEAALMERLRHADPETALALSREGDQRSPTSAFAEERAARRIDALVALDRIGEAHGEAMAFVEDHPTGELSAHVINLMGVHPHPRGPFGAAHSDDAESNR